MNASISPAAFTAATRTAADPQPTVADSILRTVARMPIADQIKLVQAIAEGSDWGTMGHVDSLALDKALTNFATDMEEAAHDEDLRMHGPVEMTRYYL